MDAKKIFDEVVSDSTVNTEYNLCKRIYESNTKIDPNFPKEEKIKVIKEFNESVNIFITTLEEWNYNPKSLLNDFGFFEWINKNEKFVEREELVRESMYGLVNVSLKIILLDELGKEQGKDLNFRDYLTDKYPKDKVIEWVKDQYNPPPKYINKQTATIICTLKKVGALINPDTKKELYIAMREVIKNIGTDAGINLHVGDEIGITERPRKYSKKQSREFIEDEINEMVEKFEGLFS